LYLNLPSASFSLQVCRKRAVHCDHFQFLLTVLLKRSHLPLFVLMEYFTIWSTSHSKRAFFR